MRNLDEIYVAARDLPPEDRSAFLDEACAGDPALRARLERMLAVADEAEAYITDLPDESETAGLPVEGLTTDLPGADDQAIGQKIGRYKILEKIGEGGCGVVYVAEQTEPVRRRVALKVIKLGMDTRQVVARFEAERQALAMMDHSNIARVLDAGSTENGRPYFIMELVRGVRITDFCDQNNLSTRERLELFIKVCQAIQHAHQKGIIHRDIKPSNILVTLHDGVAVPKVIDFGIAKAMEGRLTDSTVYTQLHQFIGTPAYMSPEQAEMSGLDIDTRSDIYSLGVLLYELLTGRTPFDGQELVSQGIDAMRRTIREREPLRPSTRLSETLVAAKRGRSGPAAGPAIPTEEEARQEARRRLRLREQIARVRGDLDWVVMKCLEKDRSRRYETANGLAQDLRRHLDNQPVMAGPPDRAYACRKFIARNRWPVAFALSVALLLLASLVGTSVGLKRASSARALADENARRADRSAGEARAAGSAARRLAYSATLLSASDALARSQIEAARFHLERAPVDLRGWEWHHLSSRLDLSDGAHAHPRSRYGRVLVMPDGGSYYDVCGDPARGIWRRDMATGRVLSVLSTNRAYWNARLLDGGRKLAVQVHDGERPDGIEVWDLERGRLMWFQAVEEMRYHCALDDSRAAYYWRDQLWLMDLATGKQTLAHPVMDGPEVAFLPGGRRLAFCPTANEIALLDIASLAVVARFKGHDNQVSSMAVSADGRWLATGSLDKRIQVRDLTEDPPALVATLQGHTDWVLGLCFSPDGSMLASCGRDQTLRLWDFRTGRCHSVLVTDGQWPVFHPDGRTVISAEGKGVRFWDVKSLDAWVLRGHRSFVYPVLLSPDGATIYSGGWGGYYGKPGSLRFWDAHTGEAIGASLVAGEYVRATALSADGSRLAVSVCMANSLPSRIDILDTATARLVTSMTNLVGAPDPLAVESLMLDPTGRTLVWVEQKGGTARMADARTGRHLKSVRIGTRSETWGYSRAAWSPDGALIAACLAGDPDIILLDATSLEPLRRFPHHHAEWVTSLAFSPDGRRLLTTSDDRTVKVWDVGTGTRLHDLVGHDNRVLCAAFSPDGKRIASGGSDHKIRIWDAGTFEPVATLSGHEDYVYSLVWRADSRQIVSGSGDNTVRIWDTQSIADRRRAQRERQEMLAKVEPMVRRIVGEMDDLDGVVERIRADTKLGSRERQVALQVLLAISIERQGTGGVSAGVSR